MKNGVKKMGMERSIPWLVISSLLPLLFSFLIIRRRKKTTEWPPSPPTLPFLGNLHQLGHASSLHHNLAKLAGLHGRLMTIFAGSWQPTIVVSDGELAREVLVTRSAIFADRSLPPAGLPLSANYRTVGTSVPDTHWHALRRGLQAGPFGPANLAAQFKYQEEDVEGMIRSMEEEGKKNGGVVQPLDHIRRASLRLIARLCFGADLAEDESLEAIDMVVELVIKGSNFLSPTDVLPFAAYIPYLNRSFKAVDAIKRYC